jgi:diacylglycerol kinase (ATP)
MGQEIWQIIANPIAGRGRAAKQAQFLERALESKRNKVTLTVTLSKGDAEKAAAAAVKSGVTKIVVSGGDGTVHEVINGIMSASQGSTNTAIGILPNGRCNDLAWALGIPNNPALSMETVLQGASRLIDLGRISDRYFSTVATLGFDSEVAEYVNNGLAPFFLRGAAAYVYAALVKLIHYRSPSVYLKGDFGEYKGPIFLVATGNTPRYGGRIKIAPTAKVDDGQLDVCLTKEVPRLEVLRMITKSFNGGHVDHPAVSIKQTRRLEIESAEPMWLWADGEPMSLTPATIEVIPQALRVLVLQ